MSQEGTNLSCLLFGAGKAKFENRPVPTIQDPHDVLIRIAYVGVCGSDVHFWAHGGITRFATEEQPIVMGHEASGTIHEFGSAVTSIKAGDRVAIEPGFSCRRCKFCKQGRYQLCPEMKFAADPPDTDGTLCRIYRIPEDFVYKIPDALSLEEAVLVEPLSVAVHGARLSELKTGQTVLVQGSGTIGLMAAAVAQAFGAGKIVIADINEKKLEFARGLVSSCETFVTDVKASPKDEAERMKKEKNLPGGADVVLECTGASSSIQTGLYASAVGGVYVQIGMSKPDQAIPLAAMMEKETVFKTSFRYGAGDYELALQMLGTGKISVKSMISSITPFERATEAWDKTKNGEGIKNLIQGVI